MVGLAERCFITLGQVPDPDDAADVATVRQTALAGLAWNVSRRLTPRALRRIRADTVYRPAERW